MKIDGYKFGQKNNWRRWAWNRICDRLEHSKRESVVVYLAGMEDLDRKVAVDKGFKPSNLIAIDKKKEVVEHLKEKGALALNGSLVDALKCFRKTSTRVDVLIGDFCCGLTSEIREFANFLNSNFVGDAFRENAVIALNFMRGREAEEAGILQVVREHEEHKDLKHRGEIFLRYFVRFAALANYIILWNHLGRDDGALRECWNSRMDAKVDDVDEITLKMEELHYFKSEPEFFSYKSGRLTMDSVVFKFYPQLTLLRSKDFDSKFVTSKVKKVERSLRATLAIRSMRESGYLSPCPVE